LASPPGHGKPALVESIAGRGGLRKPLAEMTCQTGQRRAAVFAAVVFAVLALGGCGGGSSGLPDLTKEREKPVVDANVFPPDYKQKVRDTLRQNLTNWRDVRDGAIAEPVLKPMSGTTRYVVCVRYNEKSGNAYVGVKESAAVFLSGEVTQFLDSTRELCGNAVFQRFPEIETNT
jgi:hypothetical protein